MFICHVYLFFFLIREMSVFHIEFRPLVQILTYCLVSCDPQFLASVSVSFQLYNEDLHSGMLGEVL